jgi:hypothetical protein
LLVPTIRRQPVLRAGTGPSGWPAHPYDSGVPAAVTRDQLGAWLLKCNPALWDLRGFLDSGEERLTSWAVQPNYRSDLMAAGDRALFWVSGDGRQGLFRGIWGAGHLVAEAEDWVDGERGFWVDEGGRHAVRRRIRIDVPFLAEPVAAADLRAHGIIDLEVQRQPFMGNPSWVSRPQLERLNDLLPPWPPAP